MLAQRNFYFVAEINLFNSSFAASSLSSLSKFGPSASEHILEDLPETLDLIEELREFILGNLLSFSYEVETLRAICLDWRRGV